MKLFAFIPIHTDSAPGHAIVSLPDSTIVRNANPVFVPDFDESFSARPYMALKISRLGKSIAPRFSHRYFEEVAPAFIITARNLLSSLRDAGLPWTSAIVFDKSCPMGSFLSYENLADKSLELVMTGDESKQLELPAPEVLYSAISEASRNNTLKMGDMILVPFPDQQPFELKPDTNISILFEGNPLIEIPVR